MSNAKKWYAGVVLCLVSDDLKLVQWEVEVAGTYCLHVCAVVAGSSLYFLLVDPVGCEGSGCPWVWPGSTW